MAGEKQKEARDKLEKLRAMTLEELAVEMTAVSNSEDAYKAQVEMRRRDSRQPSVLALKRRGLAMTQSASELVAQRDATSSFKATALGTIALAVGTFLLAIATGVLVWVTYHLR
jgi:hypothetical protein